MSKVRVAFLGTPDFAVMSLKTLLEDEHFEVVGVITQPDRPAGRKLQLAPSPVKVLALSQGLPVLSPESLRESPLLLETIRNWGAEVAVVVAFGQILTDEFLNLFHFGAVNVHGSILPRWRGAAPIQRSIQFGDLESGVTLQKIVRKLDAGDILGIRKVAIKQDTTAVDLYQELASLGTDLLRVELMDFVRGNLGPIPQDESLVTFAKKIDKSEALINWQENALEIDRKIRAFTMGPGTYTTYKGKKLKIHRGTAEMISPLGELKNKESRPVGKIHQIDENSIAVICGSGHLSITQVQPESRNQMSVAEFIKGHSVKVGDFFGDHLNPA